VARGNRERIYDAERDAGLCNGPGATLEGVQAWFDWAVKTKFWKDNSTVRHVRAKYPVVGKMSGAYKFSGEGERRIAEVEFGVWSLAEGTVMHESTHLMKNLYREGADDEQDHGPAFASMYLRVVKRYMGAGWAASLEKEFIKHEVKYDANWEEVKE